MRKLINLPVKTSTAAKIQVKRLFFLAALFTAVCSFAQNPNPDAILHKWEMQDKSGKMYFRKSGNTYDAILTYGRDMLEADGKTYMKDVNNPDPALRGRRLVNYVFIKNLVFKDGKWTDGELYYYKTGKYYNATITIDGNVLSLRVYVVAPIFGQTAKWNLDE